MCLVIALALHCLLRLYEDMLLKGLSHELGGGCGVDVMVLVWNLFLEWISFSNSPVNEIWLRRWCTGF